MCYKCLDDPTRFIEGRGCEKCGLIVCEKIECEGKSEHCTSCDVVMCNDCFNNHSCVGDDGSNNDGDGGDDNGDEADGDDGSDDS